MGTLRKFACDSGFVKVSKAEWVRLFTARRYWALQRSGLGASPPQAWESGKVYREVGKVRSSRVDTVRVVDGAPMMGVTLTGKGVSCWHDPKHGWVGVLDEHEHNDGGFCIYTPATDAEVSRFLPAAAAA